MEMHTVGKYLKSLREKQGLTTKDVAQKLFVREDLIKAIEKDNFKFFRASAIAKGLVKNYARLIGANIDTALALLRRQLGEPEVKLQKIDTPIKSNVVQISPLHIVAGVFILVILVFLGYLIKSYLNSLSYPSLVITQPKLKTVEVTQDVYTIKGTVEPGAVLLINDKNVEYDSKSGTFEYTLKLHEGQNIVTITAVRKYDENKKTIKKFTITYLKENQTNSNAGQADTNQVKPLNVAVYVSGGEAWIQVIVDNVQKVIGIKPDGYKKSFVVKKNFSVITGRPSITKVKINGKIIDWQTKDNSIRVDCKLENNRWLCNNTYID